MVPLVQRNPRQILYVGAPRVKNGQQENASPRGLLSAVSEIPTSSPLTSLTGQAMALLASSPPKLPRSMAWIALFHSAAWPTVFPGRLARPAAQLRLLMLFACPSVPPSVGRLITL